MRLHPLFLCSLFLLSTIAACESHGPAEATATSPPLASPTKQLTTPIPTATAAPADTAALLRQAMGPKLKGYTLESFTTGDLNQDQRPDFIALFRTTEAQDSTADKTPFYERRAALILNQGWPRLTLAAFNDDVVECTACGGRSGNDPHQGITIKGPYFSFESTHGDCIGDESVITFRYSKPEKDWFLYKYGRDTEDCMDSTETKEHEGKTSRNFGKVPFSEFMHSVLN